MNITQIEHSLLIPIVICQPDSQLIELDIIHIIKHCYMYALYIQLYSTRTEEQAKDLIQKILEVSKENVFFIFTFLLLDYSNGE